LHRDGNDLAAGVAHRVQNRPALTDATDHPVTPSSNAARRDVVRIAFRRIRAASFRLYSFSSSARGTNRTPISGS